MAATDDTISLREYVDLAVKRVSDSVTGLESRMAEINALHATAHAREHGMTETALTNAAKALDGRLAEMNEFRHQITEERQSYIAKMEFRRFEEGLNKRLDTMDGAIAAQGTQWARLFGGAAAFGFLVTILAIVGFVLR